jgi:CheY-like chemotaxis protein
MGNMVLVVEDNPSLLDMLGVTFRSSGYSTVLCPNAEAVLGRLAGQSPDAIICDVNLPGMAGTQFTDLVKLSRRFGDTPVVLMSAYGEPEKHSADAFVSKPFDPMEMVEVVDDLVSTD